MGLFNRRPKKERESFHRREFFAFKNRRTVLLQGPWQHSMLCGLLVLAAAFLIEFVVDGVFNGIDPVVAVSIFFVGYILMLDHQVKKYAREQAEHHRKLNAEKRAT